MMSVLNSGNGNSDIENSSETRRIRKATNRMQYKDKLQIISAIEKGQSKADIGKEFNIHPRTVTYIYKQKDAVIKKCKQKYSLGADYSADFNNNLMDWFITQMKANNVVTEKKLQSKAEEVANSINNFKFTSKCFDKFKILNNIVKHTGHTSGAPDKSDCLQWAKLLENFDENNIYVGGTFALLHADSLENFFTNQLSTNRFISILLFTNITGMDKQELIVAGSEMPKSLSQSLPLQYYHRQSSQIDHNVLTKVLKEWDNQLKELDRNILIAFEIPDSFLDNLELQQIKVLKCHNFKFITKTFKRIVRCFKYHYRKLQIMQTFSFRKEESDMVDYIRMLSLAWHSVSTQAVYKVFHPRLNGCVYFHMADTHYLQNEENENLSLIEWCETHGIPLKFENDLLDKFITCDKNIPSLDYNEDETVAYSLNMNDFFANGTSPLSAFEPFQAAKRLLRFIQSEDGPSEVMDSMRLLEDKLEYNACVEIQQHIVKDSTNNME